MTVTAALRAGGCEHPIQLTGITEQAHSVNAYAACKTRRASRCEPCSTLYRHDARHLIAAGLRGGKGVDEAVAGSAAYFVTFTAPSFGLVHSATDGQCRPRRNAPACPHGRALACWQSHADDDALNGQPLCSDCYDYRAAVLWNNSAPALWRVTRVNTDRLLCQALGVPVSAKVKDRPFRTQYVKVAEFQRRGLVHFHIAIRLDGVTHGAAELLAGAIRSAGTTASVEAADGSQVGWGKQLDIKAIAPEDTDDDAPRVGRRQVANYLSKYATKGSDIDDKLDRRFREVSELRLLPVNNHLARMVRMSWRLARMFPEAKLDAWSHQLGYRGHFLTKSRGWSTTFKALRQVRKDHQEAARKASWAAMNPVVVEEVITRWTYQGRGYRVGIDDAVAEILRDQRRVRRAA